MKALPRERLIQLELIWWLFTALVILAVLIPVYSSVPNYVFWTSNILFILFFITLTRYIFLLPFTFLARRQGGKIGMVFLMIPIIWYCVEQLNYFQTFLDENGVEALTGPMSFQKQQAMARYIHSEMLLFGVGAVISAVVFPFRMLLSVWRQRNRGTV